MQFPIYFITMQEALSEQDWILMSIKLSTCEYNFNTRGYHNLLTKLHVLPHVLFTPIHQDVMLHQSVLQRPLVAM